MSAIARPGVSYRDTAPASEAGVEKEALVTFSVARGRRGFEGIRGAWQERVDRQGHGVALAHAPQWYDAYIETSDDPERVFFFIARRNEEIVAIFPFERRVQFVLGVPIPAWVLPYHDHMPFSDVIASLEDLPGLVSALLQSLEEQGEWGLLLARNVVGGSAAGVLAEQPIFQHRLSRPLGDCHYLDCSQCYENLLASFSRKHRANLRRHRSNLSALGTLEVARITDADEMNRVFAEFLEVESSGWKGRAGEGTAIALHPDLERYYRRLVQTFGSRGECELNVLRLDGACVAAQFCVTVGSAWYLLKIGYDERYAKYSPGSLLLEDALVRLCADPGITNANLASDASWHLNWNPRSLRMSNYYIGAPGPAGRMAVSLVRLRMRIGRDLQQARDWVTTHWRTLRSRVKL